MQIFISYRRDDSSAHAGRLRDAFRNAFGPDRVFMDLDSIPSGARFGQRIQEAVAGSDAVVVMIGPRWLDARTSSGERRLDRPDDWVRNEVSEALGSGRPVLPVLVGGATMPTAPELPEPLQGLCDFNAAEVTDKRWDYDVGTLITDLKRAAGVHEHHLPGHRAEFATGRSRRSGRWFALGGAALAALIAVLAVVLLSGSSAPASTRLFSVSAAPFTFTYPRAWSEQAAPSRALAVGVDTADALFVLRGPTSTNLGGINKVADLTRGAMVSRSGVNLQIQDYTLPRQQNLHERDYYFSAGSAGIWQLSCTWRPGFGPTIAGPCLSAARSIRLKP